MADIQYDNPDRNARALEAVVNIQASEIAKQKVEMQKLVLFIGDLQGEIARLNAKDEFGDETQEDMAPAVNRRAKKRNKKNSSDEVHLR